MDALRPFFEDMPVKRLLITAVLAAALFPASALPQSQPINIIFTAENASCDAWLKFANNALVRAHYEFWARGFASGHNFANPAHQVKLGAFPESANLYHYVDRYCTDHPQKTFVDGIMQLVLELRDARAAKRPQARPAAKETK